MKSNPEVSVIMSVFNNAKELPGSIESILNQTWSNFEFILINDGSTDNSGEIMDDYKSKDTRIQIMHHENRGLGPSLHVGCVEAKGKFIARQDADDLSEPTRLEKQTAFLNENKNVILCGTWTRYFHERYGPQGKVCVPNDNKLIKNILSEGWNPYTHGTIMFKREMYIKEGIGYRLRTNSQDLDLWLRLLDFGDYGMVESVEYQLLLASRSLSFKRMHSRRKLRELIFRLHQERQSGGKEISNCLKEEAAIREETQDTISEEEQEIADVFTQGIRFAKMGKFDGYLECMKKATKGKGRHSRYARLFVRFGRPYWLVRRWLLWRDRKGIQPYIRYD